MKKIIFLLLITTGFSCQKYLDVKSDHRFLIPSTLKDMSQLLANLNALNFKTVPALGESNDNVTADSVQLSDITGVNKYRLAFLWQLKNNEFYQFTGGGDSWSAPYNAIYYANLVLEKMPRIEKTPQNAGEWNRVYGSALFFRAYHMAQLCWTFAKNYDENNNTDAGIVLKLENDFNNPSVRSSVKESYQQVLKDALAALELLPAVAETKFLPTRKATCALLSRVYLSMLKFSDAAHYADLFLKEQTTMLDFNNPADVIDLIVPYVDFDKEAAFATTLGNGLLQRYADTSFLNMFAADDMRKGIYFQDYFNGLSYSKIIVGGTFKSHNSFTGFRTSEMLLTRAECFARANKPDEALADLNMLCSRRYKTATFVPYTINTQPELLQLILLERRKEMVGEAVRWMDIKRLNKEFNNITIRHYDYLEKRYHELLPNEDRFACPIPTDIIKLSGMQQN
jgi:starch-binding outer membrane protein, SusD/RagB family